MKHTRLKRRGAVYYFRCKIPADLIEHYGKREILESLRTTDPKEALRKVRSRSLQQEEEFDRLRSAREVVEFSPEEVQHAVDLWTAHRLKADEEMRFAGMSQAMFEHLARLETDEELEGRSALARGARGHVEERMEDFLQGKGYRLPPKGSEGYKLLAHAFLKANVLAIKAMQERNRGEIVDTPEVAARPLPAGRRASSGQTLPELLVRWEKERQPTAKARHEWELVVRRFTEQHGSLPIDMIERQHVVAFKDRMVDSGASPATIRKHLGALGSLLQLALDNGLCAVNVSRGVRVRGSKVAAEARLPYDIEDLKRIFASPVYTDSSYRPAACGGEAAYWLPFLGLFTGARLEELGQARVEDLKEAEGVSYLDISDAGEGKSVKTASSRRRVPIHSELVRLGFLDYVAERRKAGDQRLFPLLTRDRFGKWTQNWSKWWGRYARERAGIDDPRKVFHSFRHTFKNAARLCGIPEDIHDALTGHSSGGGVGRAYGGAYPLKPLAAAMKKLRYSGVELPRARRA